MMKKGKGTQPLPAAYTISLSDIPRINEKRMAIRIKPAAERAVREGHPWLFADSIREQNFNGKPGDLAVIFDRKRHFLAVGLYDPLSPIRVRILQARQPATIQGQWFQQKVATAVALRAPIPASNTSGYRLVHGENDGLPGLVIDKYEQTLVLKLYTAAWVPHLPDLLPALTAVVKPKRIVLRLNRQLQQAPEWLYGLEDGQMLAGDMIKGPVQFLENGLSFEADVRKGQKTGFFLDQRDNRAKVEKLSAGKSVLNVFAYTGGFSLYAARGGARRVISLDLSQPALAAAMRNFKLNNKQRRVAACEHEILVGDAFQALQQMRQAKRSFELLIIDPPAFAKRQEEIERALTAYGRLVRLGLKLLRPNGILVMASCSSRVDTATFFNTVRQAAIRAGRPLQIIEETGHPLDHPVTFKEGAYLKCLFAVAP